MRSTDSDDTEHDDQDDGTNNHDVASDADDSGADLATAAVVQIPPKPGDLNWRQWAFAQEYAIDGIGTKAARRAGYNGSDVVVASTASALLKHPHVSKAVTAIQGAYAAARAARAVADVDRYSRSRLLRELETNMELGRERGQVAASNGAIKLIGREIGGFFAERSESLRREIKENYTFTMKIGDDGDPNSDDDGDQDTSTVIEGAAREVAQLEAGE